MEFANLVGQIAPDNLDGGRIQGGAIGGDTLDGQLSRLQDCLKASEKGDQILVVGIMVKNLEKQTLERAVVNDRKDAKRSIVQFVSG